MNGQQILDYARRLQATNNLGQAARVYEGLIKYLPFADEAILAQASLYDLKKLLRRGHATPRPK